MDRSGMSAPDLASVNSEPRRGMISAASQDVAALPPQRQGRGAPSELAEVRSGRAEGRLVGGATRAMVRRRRANAQIGVVCRVAIVGGVLTSLLYMV
jgi:hypothetical protein